MREGFGYADLAFVGVAIGSILATNMPKFGNVITLASLAIGFVLFLVVLVPGWARINRTDDHSEPLRIHRPEDTDKE